MNFLQILKIISLFLLQKCVSLEHIRLSVMRKEMVCKVETEMTSRQFAKAAQKKPSGGRGIDLSDRSDGDQDVGQSDLVGVLWQRKLEVGSGNLDSSSNVIA